jgi:hypothetical protein
LQFRIGVEGEGRGRIGRRGREDGGGEERGRGGCAGVRFDGIIPRIGILQEISMQKLNFVHHLQYIRPIFWIGRPHPVYKFH